MAIVFSNSFMKLLGLLAVDMGDRPGIPFFYIWDTLGWFGMDLS